MPRIISSLGHVIVEPGNSEESIEVIAKYINDLVDMLIMAPSDNLEPGVVDSQAIIQNSIDKKHVLNTNSSNLLDNPSFESVGLDATNAVDNGGADFGWDTIDPTDTNVQDVAVSSNPYQGNKVCRYRTKGQTAEASITGSGDMGVIDKYNDGVIQAAQGDVFTFSFYAKYVAVSGGSGTYVTPSPLTSMSGYIQFRGKDGSIKSTVSTTTQNITTSWVQHSTPLATAPADTAYITAGIKIANTANTNLYYFDACKLANTDVSDASGYMCANKTLAATTIAGYTKNVNNWVAVPTSWTSNIASDWSESSGAFSYAGDFPPSGSRKFIVSYQASFYGYSTNQYWRMLGRLVKTPSGGALTEIPGSVQHSSQYGSQIYLAYFMTHHLSGEAIVSISAGDTIGFQYGHYVSHAGAAAYTIGSLQTLTGMSGMTINVTPVDQ